MLHIQAKRFFGDKITHFGFKSIPENLKENMGKSLHLFVVAQVLPLVPFKPNQAYVVLIAHIDIIAELAST